MLKRPEILPDSGGLRGELRNSNQQRSGQAPEGFTDAKAAGKPSRSGGLGGELRNYNGGNGMEKWLYVMIMKKGKTFNKVTKAVITRHVEHLRNLDADGK